MADLATFKEKAEKSTGCAELARIYDLPANGKSRDWLRDVAAMVGVTDEMFRANLSKSRRLRPIVTKKCPVCGGSFQAEEGAPKELTYCSRKCGNQNRTLSQETKDKISRTHSARLARLGLTKKPLPAKPCGFCAKEFIPRLERSTYCSPSCRGKGIGRTSETREKRRQIQLRCIAEGKHKGWTSRAKVNVSYAERFFITVLQNNGIAYERELSQASYFIDFAITLPNGFKIALEIDGKQHQMPDRQLSDRYKDIALESLGWNVYRIPWKAISSDAGKAYIRGEIERFIAFYTAFVA